MTYPHSHKTVIVLDRSPNFFESSRHQVDFDVFMKPKGPGMIPIAPIYKSLWTCNAEAALEYIRIVYDIFPTDKLIQLVVSDSKAFSINSWNQSDQSLQHIINTLAHNPPNADQLKSRLPTDFSILNGIDQALDVLCQTSAIQHQTRTSLTESASALANRGRIICFTQFKSDDHVRKLEDCVQEALSQHNQHASSTDTLMPINHCELVLIDVFPVGRSGNCTSQPKRHVSSLLTSELHCSQSGKYVAMKSIELCMNHFNLSSTTVTGIPMKEEQNASSSANYDVELLHVLDAHNDLMKSGQQEGLVVQSREVQYTESITLKWCTPKTTAAELHQCNGAFRITPVDVNSRPSSCLTNFLLSGRTVMLEQPRKTGNKLISHMLSSHGGEVFIHSLATWRSILEDPPSISEGAGGRLTDYRINDFGEFMKDNRLAPSVSMSSGLLPIDRAKLQMERMTRHWPLVISDTIIFNMASVLDPLPATIVKESLTEAEVLECRKVIYHIVAMENRNEALPIPASGVRGKGVKRDEQYRQMWSELERFVSAHSSSSVQHRDILKCLLDCKRPSAEESSHVAKQESKVKEEKPEGAPCDPRLMKPEDRVKIEFSIKREPEIDVELPAKKFKIGFGNASGGPPQSLLSLWTNKINAMHKSQCLEFSGRQDANGGKAELYQNLKENTTNGNSTTEKNAVARKS